MSSRLLQHKAANGERSVLLAEGDRAVVLPGVASVRELALKAIAAQSTLATLIAGMQRGAVVDLSEAAASGRLLCPIDHDDPAHIFVAGTGLTHLGSAEGRDKMHRDAIDAAKMTPSMQLFLDGLEGGKPAAGQIGSQPEWFYKGDGSNLVGTGVELQLPSFSLDGSEEPEIAAIYIIGPDGTPFRLGVCLGNEFSDHECEQRNYLLLAHSKLRPAALGPELLLGPIPDSIEGQSRILRGGDILWEKPFLSGEGNMSHTIANLEYHHFKYPQFRQPGDIHVHFYGTATLSFSDGVRTQAGDVFEIEASPFKLPLRNPLARSAVEDIVVKAL